MASDLEKARELIRMHETFVGPMETLRENIDKAVADGIALGRKEGFEMAIKAIQGLIGKSTL
jgi:hypothetical protein